MHSVHLFITMTSYFKPKSSQILFHRSLQRLTDYFGKSYLTHAKCILHIYKIKNQANSIQQNTSWEAGSCLASIVVNFWQRIHEILTKLILILYFLTTLMKRYINIFSLVNDFICFLSSKEISWNPCTFQELLLAEATDSIWNQIFVSLSPVTYLSACAMGPLEYRFYNWLHHRRRNLI